jgi:hypothetical protein
LTGFAKTSKSYCDISTRKKFGFNKNKELKKNFNLVIIKE